MKRLVLMACICSMTGSVAWAHRDQDRARLAVQQGLVLPLQQVLSKLEAQQPGQVLEVELETRQNRWIYEIKLIDPAGQLLRLTLDAQNGHILQRRLRSAKRQDADHHKGRPLFSPNPNASAAD